MHKLQTVPITGLTLKKKMVIHSKLQHHVTHPSHDATTYMDGLPLHRRNERNKVLQYLCTSNDESAAKIGTRVCMASCKPQSG